jgi:hypothetical protein
MLKLDEKVLDVAGHTDTTPAGCVVPLDVNTCKFVASHVELDPMELLENIAEMVKVFCPNILHPKLITMRQNWMGHHLWCQRPGVDLAL